MESGLLTGLVEGIYLSAMYALIAVGLTLCFGVLRIFNFAHGEFLMVGGFVMWVMFGQQELPFFVALLAAILFVGALALLIERGLFRLTRANPFNGFIISLALVYILQVSALLYFGPLTWAVPSFIRGYVELGGSQFSIQRLVMIPVIVGVLAFVWMLLERTRFGRSVRASIQDKEAAFLQGINFDWTSAIVMLIAGFLAGLAGALTSLTMEVSPQMGSLLILKAFIIVIVGGMGSVGGTVVAAVLLGFLDVTVAMVFNPRVTPLFGAIVMLLVLLIKPRGLFGHE